MGAMQDRGVVRFPPRSRHWVFECDEVMLPPEFYLIAIKRRTKAGQPPLVNRFLAICLVSGGSIKSDLLQIRSDDARQLRSAVEPKIERPAAVETADDRIGGPSPPK